MSHHTGWCDVPSHEMMWWANFNFSCGCGFQCGDCGDAFIKPEKAQKRSVNSPAAFLLQRCCKHKLKHFMRSQQLLISSHTQQAARVATRLSIAHLYPWGQAAVSQIWKHQPFCWKWLNPDLAELLLFYFLEFYTIFYKASSSFRSELSTNVFQ